MARLLPLDGNSRDVKPANGKHFTIKECYRLISCSTVEVIGLADGRKLIVDENGRLRNSPPNLVATHMAKHVLPKLGING